MWMESTRNGSSCQKTAGGQEAGRRRREKKEKKETKHQRHSMHSNDHRSLGEFVWNSERRKITDCSQKSAASPSNRVLYVPHVHFSNYLSSGFSSQGNKCSGVTSICQHLWCVWKQLWSSLFSCYQMKYWLPTSWNKLSFSSDGCFFFIINSSIYSYRNNWADFWRKCWGSECLNSSTGLPAGFPTMTRQHQG